MNVIHFAPQKTSAQKRLATHLADRLPRGRLIAYRSLRELDTSLRRPGMTPAVLLLFPSGAQELEGLVRMQALLDGLPAVVVLPAETPQLVTTALKLRPRFIAFQSRDFTDVAAVVLKLIAGRSESGGPPD